MRIRRLTLCNFGPYRDEQTIELDAKVYAIVAQHVENPDRSNWLGKTTFLESIDFALYGNHRYAKEDLWISREASEGFVELETTDGMIIRRARSRGKSTKLTVDDGGRNLAKDEADAHIVTRIGLDKADFRNTSYFEQRAMARFVNADPGVRMGIIASWFRLEPLQECEKAVRTQATDLADAVQALETQIAGKRSYIIQNYRATSPASTSAAPSAEMMVESMEQEAAVATKKVSDLEAEVDDLQAQLLAGVADRAEWAGHQEKAAEWDRVAARGKFRAGELSALRTVHEEADTATPKAIESLKEGMMFATTRKQVAYADLTRATTEATQKGQLAKGEFDGLCPVAGIQCPAKDEINAPRKRNLVMFDEAKATKAKAQAAYTLAVEEVADAQRRHEKAVGSVSEAKERLASMARLESELESLRALAGTLHTSVLRVKGEPPEDIAPIKAEIGKLRTEIDELRASGSYQTRAAQAITTTMRELVLLEAELVEKFKEASVFREAVQIFGRNGAQKRVAEGALSKIEAGANDLLKTCGIDLSMGVQWAREGGGLATECEICGTPFPASARVKACVKCKAERGPKMVNKLDITLSDRSGAAEDLAGIAFQLSASAWLRNDRSSAWGTACIDEPFTALDTANRKALAIHFATMLKGTYGYEQSFIVAHNRDVMESLPARIEIFADAKGSKLNVVG
jgi:DNA repair exonuclease SbcCD ATPase subunit